MYAKLNIQVLVQESDRRFKDIDNKLKTICDALRVPGKGELSGGSELENEGEEPFFCLLADDAYIYQIAVDTDYLLCKHANHKLVEDENESLWIINVEIKGNRFDQNYMDLLV
jgi:hypothetical protein